MSQYSIDSHNPEWAGKFNELKLMFLGVLKDKVTSIEHVGSTSIVGMKAKPIIDVLILVKNIEDLEEELEIIRSMGYVIRENVLSDRSLLFEKISAGNKSENVHVFEMGSNYAQEHFINTRDYLRNHPDAVKEYEELKEALYLKHPDDYMAYRAGKDGFLKNLEKTAKEWAGEK